MMKADNPREFDSADPAHLEPAEEPRAPVLINPTESSSPGGQRCAGEADPAPALTVILPIRNEASHIGALLEELSEQSLPLGRFEVLVVDGMSTDGTRAIASEALRRFPAGRLLDNPKGLASAARNIGVANASTPYVLFIDGHCTIPHRDMLKAALHAFQQGERCLSRPQHLVGTTLFQKAVALARGAPLGHYSGSQIYEEDDRHCDPTSAGCGYSRDLYLDLGGVDESLDAAEDLEFNVRVHRSGIQALHSRRFGLAYHARSRWSALFRQMYRYGYGRARLALKHPYAFSPLAAGASAVSIAAVVMPGIGMFWPPAWYLWLVGAISYGVIVATAAASVTRGGGVRLWLATTACFPAIHFGSGLGYLAGLVGGPSFQHARDATSAAKSAGARVN